MLSTFQRRLPARVHLTILSRYGNIIENFVSNDLEGAFFGSFTGALALRMLDVEPLARPEYADGTSTYHGLIFVRRDSGITSAEDMRGKRFAFVDKATTAGWLLPLHYFKTHGVDDHRSWLKEAYFTGTHEGAIYDVLDRKGGHRCCQEHRLSGGSPRRDPRVSDELIILARSPDVPENALLVRKDLDEALKTKLKETLLNMHQDKEGKRDTRASSAR